MWKQLDICSCFWALNDFICFILEAALVQRLGRSQLFSFPSRIFKRAWLQMVPSSPLFSCWMVTGFLSWVHSFILWCMYCIKISCGWWHFCFPRHQVGCRLFLAGACSVSAVASCLGQRKALSWKSVMMGLFFPDIYPEHCILGLCNKSIKLQFAIRTLLFTW